MDNALVVCMKRIYLVQNLIFDILNTSRCLCFFTSVARLIVQWENWNQSMNEKNDKLQFSQFICAETSSHSYLLYLP